MNDIMVHNGLLRRTLWVDAVASGAMGLLLAGAAPALDRPLGVPTGWLVGIGIFLVGYAAALARLATRTRIPTGPARTVVIGNAMWVAASVAVVLTGAFALTDLGTALVLAQAAAVLVFADLEYVGLRRTRTPVPA